ncbi:MAG: glycosyltransferase family 4 protein [Rhodospirillum sp.]|nr:glycosyltransferase family 4 protein [Rhodospirillum sp.]MCF8490520.1 glycosyltransferase family 4 protein [Rhodospirillum sp.]
MKIGIGWQVGVPSGWGTYGLNLCVHLERLGHRAVPLSLAHDLSLDPLTERLLAPTLREHMFADKLRVLHGALDLPHPVLHGLGDGLEVSDFSDANRGAPDIGVVFFESAVVPKPNLERARDLPLIVTGSSWNQMVLEAHGLTNARFCPQGVDPSLFHPAPPAKRAPVGRYLIFSGGKLEYRKGQDIALAAFKVFHDRHPEALLVTAWHNLWPESLAGLTDSALVKSLPQVDGRGRIKVADWAAAEHGLPRDAILDLGPQTNASAPRLLGDMDLAIFPNRCEGGTNLVAMEAMAMGLPVVLSANTGHLDLIQGGETLGEPVCWAVRDQAAIAEITGDISRTGWGETPIEALVDAMEEAYQNRAEAKRRGAAAARMMADWSWETQVRRLLVEVEAVA